MHDQTPKDTIWLNIGQARARGKVSRQWLYKWMNRGDLRSKRDGYGSLRYFDQTTLDVCLEAHSRWLSGYRANQESALAGNSNTKNEFLEPQTT